MATVRERNALATYSQVFIGDRWVDAAQATVPAGGTAFPVTRTAAGRTAR
jgi:hypothetical protein